MKLKFTNDPEKYNVVYLETGEKIGWIKDKEFCIRGLGTKHFDSKTSAESFLISHFNNLGESRMNDIMKDIKGFVSENRQIIYWMALIFLADHFFFNGAFRERLKGLAEKMLGKVEKQIEAK